MPLLPHQTCGTCRFWSLGKGQFGECRAKAPAMSRECRTVHWSEHETYIVANFPVTTDEQWCGEWCRDLTPTAPTDG